MKLVSLKEGAVGLDAVGNGGEARRRLWLGAHGIDVARSMVGRDFCPMRREVRVGGHRRPRGAAIGIASCHHRQALDKPHAPEMSEHSNWTPTR